MKKNHVKCKICGKEHALGGCPEFQSTAARNGRAGTEAVDTVRSGKGSLRRKPIGPESLNDGTVSGEATASEYQASPVDTSPKPKIGRPRTGFNKKEYNRQFTADLRALRRLGLDCTVKEYRSLKEARND